MTFTDGTEYLGWMLENCSSCPLWRSDDPTCKTLPEREAAFLDGAEFDKSLCIEGKRR